MTFYDREEKGLLDQIELATCRKKRKLEAVMGMMTVPLNRILVSSDLNR